MAAAANASSPHDAGSEPLAPRALTNLRVPLLVIGLIAYGITIGLGYAGGTAVRTQFMSAYLWSFIFWMGIGVGGSGLSMIHHLSGGRWGLPTRRVLEAASLTIPFAALLVIPILLNFDVLYPWAPANSGHFAYDKELQYQLGIWWHPDWIRWEVIGAFVVLSLFAWWIGSMSIRYGRTGDPRIVTTMKYASAWGMILLFVCVSVYVIDLVIGREAHFYSTMFEVKLIVGSALSAWAFTLLQMPVLKRAPEVDALTPPGLLNDCGSMMFAMTVLWAYVSFFELLIVWMGNISSDSSWFVRRGIGGIWHNGWTAVAVLLLTVHFFLPFILLLQRPIKRVASRLSRVALLLLCLRMLDIIWHCKPTSLDDVMPNGSIAQPGTGSSMVSWFDFVVPIGIGGIWLFLYLTFLASRPILPRSEHEDVLRAELAARGATPVHM